MHEASGVGYGFGEFRLPFDSIFDSIFYLVVCCFDVVNFDSVPHFDCRKGSTWSCLQSPKQSQMGCEQVIEKKWVGAQ